MWEKQIRGRTSESEGVPGAARRCHTRSATGTSPFAQLLISALQCSIPCLPSSPPRSAPGWELQCSSVGKPQSPAPLLPAGSRVPESPTSPRLCALPSPRSPRRALRVPEEDVTLQERDGGRTGPYPIAHDPVRGTLGTRSPARLRMELP